LKIDIYEDEMVAAITKSMLLNDISRKETLK